MEKKMEHDLETTRILENQMERTTMEHEMETAAV